MNIEVIRKDFPILEEKVYGKPLVYLDNGATTQRPGQVVEKMSEYYLRYNANVHRGVHYLSNMCTDAHEGARVLVRDFIGASSIEEVIFTRGTTESINLVAYTFGEAFIHEGDEILITEMEHHSNIVPWQMLCDRKKALLKVVPIQHNGELNMELFRQMLTTKVKLVAVAYVSNVLGTVNPVRDIIDLAHAAGARVLIDAAQAVQHIPVNMKVLDCDFFVFSGHKMYGPTGVGVLYGKKELLEKMPPWHGGGEMIKTVTFEKTTYNDLPFKFEAGTPDFIGIIGLGEAVKYIESIGLREIEQYETELLHYAMEQMRQLPDIVFYGEASHKSSVISFGIDGIHPFDLGTLLDRMGIAIRTGQLCAEPVMDHYGIPAMARASLAMYNTREEIDIFCEALRKVTAMLR